MKNITLIILMIICSVQCKKSKSVKDNPFGLPNATTSGAMTFACLVNGIPYIVKNSTIYIGGGVTEDSTYGFGRDGEGAYFDLLFFKLKKKYSTNTWLLLEDESNYFDIAGIKDCRGYFLDPYRLKGTGRLYFSKIDPVNKIMSGLFECTIAVPFCDTLKMTEGRFDFKYFN